MKTSSIDCIAPVETSEGKNFSKESDVIGHAAMALYNVLYVKIKQSWLIDFEQLH